MYNCNPLQWDRIPQPPQAIKIAWPRPCASAHFQGTLRQHSLLLQFSGTTGRNTDCPRKLWLGDICFTKHVSSAVVIQ